MLIVYQHQGSPLCVADNLSGADPAEWLNRFGNPPFYLVDPAIPDGWRENRSGVTVDWGTGTVSLAAPPPPQVVSRFQARAALHLAGLLTTVEALMAAPETDMLARLAWADATEFRRDSPTLVAMAAALSLTDEQLDQLFITAAGLVA